MTLSPQSLAIAGVVGLLSGAHAAIWGMYKDSVHEGFTVGRFARSIVVGTAAAVTLQAVLGLTVPGAAALVVLFGLAYAAERGIVEVWKTFVRNEDQSKYFIPMQFTMLGIPVARRGARLAAGAAYVGAVALCLFAVAWLDRGAESLAAGRVAVVGLAVGTIIAAGGAWKDAPKEGFQVLKFFRSPIMTALFALLLSRLTDSALLATVSAMGFERATVETYKTFFFPSGPPGKFAGKPVLHPHMLVRRTRFVPAYLAIWAAMLVVGTVAFRDAAPRESRAPLRVVGARR